MDRNYIMNLPTGVKRVYTDNLGVGTSLIVEMENGFRVVISALHLGEHECDVGVFYPNPEGPYDNPAGGIGFGGPSPDACLYAQDGTFIGQIN